MKKTLYIYDLTRLLSRRHQPFATGIDQIDLMFARETLDKAPHQTVFVTHAFDRLKFVPQNIASDIIDCLYRRWILGTSEETGIELKVEANGLTSSIYLPKTIKSPRVLWSPYLYARAIYFHISFFCLEHFRRKILGVTTKCCTKLFRDNDCTYLCFSHSGFARNKKFIGVCQKYNMSVVAYIHDLIPIEYPQYCIPKAKRRLSNFIRNILTTSDLVLTNSDATSMSIETYVNDNFDASKKIDLIKIYPGINLCKPDSTFIPPSYPYFVVLGTIEPRKNLILILNIWERLIATLQNDCPVLLVIGKRGWLNSDTFTKLNHLTLKTDKVLELPNLSSQQVTNYVSQANALLFPSHCEGFGLPLAEAIHLGIPTITNRLPIFREIAGNTPIYCTSVEEWEQAIIKLSVSKVLESNPLNKKLFSWDVAFKRYWTTLKTLNSNH